MKGVPNQNGLSQEVRMKLQQNLGRPRRQRDEDKEGRCFKAEGRAAYRDTGRRDKAESVGSGKAVLVGSPCKLVHLRKQC